MEAGKEKKRKTLKYKLFVLFTSIVSVINANSVTLNQKTFLILKTLNLPHSIIVMHVVTLVMEQLLS